jgi:hypothetical protein
MKPHNYNNIHRVLDPFAPKGYSFLYKDMIFNSFVEAKAYVEALELI